MPFTYDEAVSGIEKERWKIAMCEEIKDIDKKETWKLVPRPEGGKVVNKMGIHEEERRK